MNYIQIKSGIKPPDISAFKPFRSVVIIESIVTSEWQNSISDWLVSSGCLYMMAWGFDCSLWDDSVDYSNLKASNFEEIPEDEFVITTWHDNEPLEEVFWFSKHNATHPSIDIQNTILLHISDSNKEEDLLETYKRA